MIVQRWPRLGERKIAFPFCGFAFLGDNLWTFNFPAIYSESEEKIFFPLLNEKGFGFVPNFCNRNEKSRLRFVKLVVLLSIPQRSFSYKCLVKIVKQTKIDSKINVKNKEPLQINRLNKDGITLRKVTLYQSFG